jgi:hypothetical protein
MKFIRFFFVAAIAVFSFEFSTASAAPLLAAAPATFSQASAAKTPQHNRHIRRHRRRIHHQHHR